ncbi:MAG: poly-gamma-glutamate synthase PgsB [Candidatus Promineifilaceae bacterium]
MIGFIIVSLISATLFAHWRRKTRTHDTRLEQLPIRIHVNGIRGKSTVTRLIAAVLREGGYRTVAKTTGYTTHIISENGDEQLMAQHDTPTIRKQIDLIKQHVTPQTEALVLECMAVNRLNQRAKPPQIVKGDITVITNVRDDHQDVMGHTLTAIADALLRTIPVNGVLISAETQPELREQLANNARKRDSDFCYASTKTISDADLQGFNYLTFKENIAIGLTIADMFDIPRATALNGMRRALPDIGTVALERTHINGKELIWAPLFAANDRESTIASIEALRQHHRPDCTRIGILNNRLDRAVRALKFGEIAAEDLQLDYYITFGAYEHQVANMMVALGYPRERIIHLGMSRNPSEADILDAVTDLIDGTQGMLIGMVNPQTPQADLLIEYFERVGYHKKSLTCLVADPTHIPTIAQRQQGLLNRLFHPEPAQIM